MLRKNLPPLSSACERKVAGTAEAAIKLKQSHQLVVDGKLGGTTRLKHTRPFRGMRVLFYFNLTCVDKDMNFS